MRGLKKGKLLLGRFRATIPWLAKLSRRAPCSHGRHGRDRTPGVIVRKSPYFAEELIIRLGSRPLHQGLNLRLELVHFEVGVRPRIHERRFVKRAHQGANLGQFKQARAGWNQQADRQLHGRDGSDQSKPGNHFQKVQVTVQGGPRRERHEGWSQR